LGKDYAKICRDGQVQWYCGRHFEFLDRLLFETELLNQKVDELLKEFVRVRALALEIAQKLYRPPRKIQVAKNQDSTG